MIICPICKNDLFIDNKSYKCKNSHSFDISKSGYTNLLLSNNKASKDPGDNKEMVLARHNFLLTDKYISLKKSLVEITNLNLDSFLDVACGEGYYTKGISENFNNSVGIDISKYAINISSKIDKKTKYFISSLYNLPVKDESVDVLLNCFAPICDSEFLRVLKKNGLFIRVLPNENHLIELKGVIYDNPYLNEVKYEEFTGFELINNYYVDDLITLNNKEINDLFLMTPYYYKSPIKGSNRLKSLDTLTTKISFIISIYKKI